MASTTDVKVPFFKKKRARPTTNRQRTPSPPASAMTVSYPSSSGSQVVLPSRKTTANLLSAGSKRTSSQRVQDDGDAESRREGPGINWTSGGGAVNAALEILEGDEAEEMLAKRLKKDDAEEVGVPQDGLYRGQKGYNVHLAKSKDVPKAMRVGPQRSTTSVIKTVTMMDYQPDVCKDYKETGFCGFGDTCKFLHDRGTYLQGWQLDKIAADPKKQAGDDGGSSDSDDEKIPFKCLIGRHPYTDPVVTKCGHYFCSSCAIKRFAKTPKCAACGAPTGGIFNRADKVVEKMRKMQQAGKKDSDAEDDVDEAERGDVQIEGLGDGDSGSDDN